MSGASGPITPTAIDLNNIGSVLDDQGKLHEALEKYTAALAIDERSINNIGSVSEGEAQHERSLGADHPEVVVELNNIGPVLETQGKLDEALEKPRSTRWLPPLTSAASDPR